MAPVNSSDSNEMHRFRDFVQYFRSAPLWQTGLLFLFSLYVTAFVAYQTFLQVEHDAEKNFEIAVNELQLKIEERLDIHKRLLLAGAAMFDASNFVDRDEWHAYARRFHEDINFDGVQGLGVAVWLEKDRIAEHVETMRANGWPDYDLDSTLSNDGRSAVLYIEPFNGANAHKIGFDMYANPALRAAMDESRDSGRVVFSHMTGNGDMLDVTPSIFMFMPVYKKAMPADSIAYRREALYGWIYSPIHIEAFLHSIISEWHNPKSEFIQTRIYDGFPEDNGRLLFSNELDEERMGMDAFFLQSAISFGDHAWVLDFRRVKGPDSGIDYGKVWITAVAGAIVSGLLSLLVLALLTTRSKAVSMANRLTASLRQSQDLLKIAGTRAKVGGWMLDVTDNRVYLSDEIRAILEMSADEDIGLDQGLSLYTDESRALISAALKNCIKTGTPFAIDLELHTVKGNALYAHVIGYAIADQSGRTIRVEGALQDITEQKIREAALVESEAKLAAVFNQSYLFQVLMQLDGTVVEANQLTLDICGYTREQVVGVKVWQMPHWTPDAQLMMTIRKLVERSAQGYPGHASSHYYVADGALRNIEFTLTPIFDDGGRIIIMLLSGMDTTEREQKDAVLIKEREFLNALLESLSEGIVACDEAAVLTVFNRVTRDLHGLPEEPLPPESWAEHYSLFDASGQQLLPTDQIPLFRALKGEHLLDAEIMIAPKDRPKRVVQCSGQPILTPDGKQLGAVIAMRDVTEQKQSALELQRLNRALRMLSLCNETLVRASNEKQLLSDICKLAVEVGGYYMAWVGYAEHDAASSIVLQAHEGGPEDFFTKLSLSWAPESPGGQSTGARSIRSGVPVIIEDVMQDKNYPLQALALKYGYRGVMSLPLKHQQKTFGFLALYSVDVRPVAEDELKLLQELAEDMAFGIVSLRAEEERRRIQSAVLKMAAGVSAIAGTSFFEQLARNMADALGADAAFIARFAGDTASRVHTVAGVVDGKAVDNFTYAFAGSPCERLSGKDYCMVPFGLAQEYPQSSTYIDIPAEAYLGGRLTNSAGKFIGLLFVLYRKPLAATDLLISTLRVFAARAAAELERQEGEQQLREQASLLDKAQDAIIVRDLSDRILYWNKSAERLYGWKAEEVIGQNVDAEIFVDSDAMRQTLLAVHELGEWVGEFHQQRKDGTHLIVESHRTLVRDDSGQPKSILVINTDITQRKEAEQQIKQLAFYDELTQLPNRRLFMDTLRALLAVADRTERSALLLIDLDNFKELNDTFGHDIGDQLLREVARRLTFCVRDTDTVARLGGDEFVVILDALDNDQARARSQVQRVGNKILDTFAEPFRLGGHEHRSSPSIGATLIEPGARRVDELLKRADIAMYQAKMAGRNTMRFFDPDMQSAVARRVAMEEDLHLALQNQEFIPYYQPQVDDAGLMTGAEVLVRWQHPQRGIVEPAEFIPLAEDTGLIIPMGEAILRSACEQLVRWAGSPQFSELTLAVNVSLRQFRHPEFVQQVLDIVNSTGASPHRLKLELTETVLIEDIEDVISKMGQLKSSGVSFALDDFGTGYSSLSYLKVLPLDQLKIDRSFVRDVLDDPDDAAIARTIITLGKSMGLSVMAEGVETEGQREFLVQSGCHFFQGYLFSPPLPAAELEHYLQQHGLRSQ